MNGFFVFQPRPSDADEIEAAADIAAVHNFMGSLDEDGLYALSVILSSCSNAEHGPKRAIHLHGQVSAIGRTRFDLCHCGSKHKSFEHGQAIEAKKVKYDSTMLEAYSVSHPDEMSPSVFCNECSCEYPTLDKRIESGNCHCGAGPIVNG